MACYEGVKASSCYWLCFEKVFQGKHHIWEDIIGKCVSDQFVGLQVLVDYASGLPPKYNNNFHSTLGGTPSEKVMYPLMVKGLLSPDESFS